MIERAKQILEKVKVWGIPGIVGFFRRKYVFAVQRRRLATLAKKSKVKEPQPGITVIGELTGQVSLSKTLRDFILCLKEAGVPCQAYDTLLKSQIPAKDIDGIITPIADFDLKRYSHIVMMYRSPLDENLVKGITCARIAFHESEHGIHETAPYLKASGDAIVGMSDFNYEYYRRAFSAQPVFKIVYPFRFKLENATPRDVLRGKYEIGADDFVVFFNFDFGSYYRKNIPAAIRAFSKAFGNDPTAKLLFKTKGAKHNPKQVKEMMAEVAAAGIVSQFIHISHYLPQGDIDGLTGACDVYLSLHKAEGFGLGMAEAMSQGKPVVATDWSANTEFCRPDTAWCIPYKMTPILPHEYMESMKEWAEADVDAAAAALREIRDNPKLAAERAAHGKRFMEEHFSIANFKADVEKMLAPCACSSI
jgi:glycosyltransferase involved in cell wall biosynthesis